MGPFKRVVWIVLDSVGIGELPDAAEYGDVGRTTLGHIAESRPLKIPTLVQLGLANIAPLAHLPAASAPIVVPDFLAKFSIHPRSIQGAGGASKLKPPLTDGSKTVGCPCTRSTGAK